MSQKRAAAYAQNPDAARLLRDNVLKHIGLPPQGIVSSYNARGDEMDPAWLTDALRARGYAIALPVVTGKDAPLLFRIHNPGDKLVPGAMDIPEPAPSAPEAEPDILLVPLLAFDRRGYRLGYGGGYYDRTLAALRRKKRVLAIGIAFACQEIPQVPAGPYDARLDKIATEIQIL